MCAGNTLTNADALEKPPAGEQKQQSAGSAGAAAPADSAAAAAAAGAAFTATAAAKKPSRKRTRAGKSKSASGNAKRDSDDDVEMAAGDSKEGKASKEGKESKERKGAGVSGAVSGEDFVFVSGDAARSVDAASLPALADRRAIDNSRRVTLVFETKAAATMHGFAGYFDSKLYKDVHISESIVADLECSGSTLYCCCLRSFLQAFTSRPSPRTCSAGSRSTSPFGCFRLVELPPAGLTSAFSLSVGW